MLQNLHVKNLALIEEADVELQNGLNILTGETGAGKSIIIGSVNLALGEKVPKEMLRDNETPALVELVFEVSNPNTVQRLKELGVEAEDGQVILSRKISQGRSVARVNGETVAASSLKEIASLLIDIHGQHEHQSLLNKKKHLELVDEYALMQYGAQFRELKERVGKEYHALKAIIAELENSTMDESAKARELSLLQYEVEEITEAQLVAGEDAELEAEFRRFSNGKKIMEAASKAYGYAGQDVDCAADLIARAVRELQGVSGYDEALENLSQQISEIDSLLADFNRELSTYIGDADFDEAKFFDIQQRLDFINRLKAKYGDSIEKILAICEEKMQAIERLQDYDAYVAKKKAELVKQEESLKALCEELTTKRRQAAEELCKAIGLALADLNFLDVKFLMEFHELEDYTAGGKDEAEFMISVNPGEPIKPLAKVASGGELSRIMLAIKTVMADEDGIDTLIFDEIDSGISGRTAQMVSEKMNALGKTHQIICITHLPQIAAMADGHFLIEKAVEQEATVSHIRRLTEEQSVEELARMLGGVEITDIVKENAREMKAMARNKKG